MPDPPQSPSGTSLAGQAAGGRADGGEVEMGRAGRDEGLDVLAEAAVAAEPGEVPRDHAAAGQHDEALGSIAGLDDGELEALGPRRAGGDRAVAAAVGEEQGEPGEAAAKARDQGRVLPVGPVTGGLARGMALIHARLTTLTRTPRACRAVARSSRQLPVAPGPAGRGTDGSGRCLASQARNSSQPVSSSAHAARRRRSPSSRAASSLALPLSMPTLLTRPARPMAPAPSWPSVHPGSPAGPVPYIPSDTGGGRRGGADPRDRHEARGMAKLAAALPASGPPADTAAGLQGMSAKPTGAEPASMRRHAPGGRDRARRPQPAARAGRPPPTRPGSARSDRGAPAAAPSPPQRRAHGQSRKRHLRHRLFEVAAWRRGPALVTRRELRALGHRVVLLPDRRFDRAEEHSRPPRRDRDAAPCKRASHRDPSLAATPLAHQRLLCLSPHMVEPTSVRNTLPGSRAWSGAGG